jgi:glutathione-specific gamma-glutamylcyclotransferase
VRLIGLCQQRHTESERVWGAAYRIVPSKVKEVKGYLDIREINGYSVQYTSFHPADPHLKEIRCLVYIGMPDNPQFIGAIPPQDVAKRINQSIGPSGENRDYLLQLEESLKDLSAESGDAHISDLAQRVRNMEPRQIVLNRQSDRKLGLHGISSAKEQEEIEKES